MICLLGPSGCGKTTLLLRIAAGIEDPTAGEMRMDGVLVASPGASMPPERRGIGLVFQDYALFPQMTVLDNVMFGLRGLSRAAAASAAGVAMARVGLSALADAYPYMLSAAASSSASRSPARSCRGPACSSWTSPSPTSTAACAMPFATTRSPAARNRRHLHHGDA